jgi:putative transposase
MPWNQTDAMSERLKMIGEHLSGAYGPAELARRYGVSRKTIYEWIARYQQEGVEGLKERSSAPHQHPNATVQEIVDEIMRLKAQWPHWGAPKLLARLKREMKVGACPAESTVSEILKRHGLSFPRKKRRHAVPSSQPLAHAQEPNALWCVDFKGWFRTSDGSKCVPLTLTDAYSRYLLRCQGLGESTGYLLVQPIMISAFREHGMPWAIRSDNGPPFAACTLGGLSKLSVWWLRLGIKVERIAPGKPQQNGRHERFHRTLEEHTAAPPAGTLAAQQRRFDQFRGEYNKHRPHEALGQDTPAEHYAPSSRGYPSRLPAAREFPDDWQKRRVRTTGQMKWNGTPVQVTEALAGEYVGLEPVGDGRWAVWFQDLELGLFDERTMKVRGHKNMRSRA